MTVLPELVQAPEVGCIVLKVLNLNPNNCSGWRAHIVVLWILDWQKVCREGGVQGLGQQHKLEGDFLLQFHRDGVGLLQSVAVKKVRTLINLP